MSLRPLLSLLLCLAFAAPASGQAPADWSQHVAYEMDITLHADRHQMDGWQQLTYTNNSPDTLHTVYYHLYFNAFRPNSMMAERNRHLPDPDARIVPRIWSLGPDEMGYHRIESLTQDGEAVSYEITDTIVRVDLAHPIPPGTSTTFEMTFHSQVPLQTRRSGRDNREGIDYSMSQWYPKIAEYDERGWHADPYVGREFYAPYGRFDVQITLPARYTIGATGVLQNPGEIGHGYARNGSATYHPSDGAYPTTDSLTWHFTADHVHDFVWAADPDYIHEQIRADDGRTYHLLYEGDVEDRWQPMRQWVPELIQFYSHEFGPYPYPQFTVAQAGDGGMEYPMVNLITGERGRRSLLGVTAHEAAHEWFYATLGNNESDYAWMDEGFTSYATTEGFAHILGRDNPSHWGDYLSFISAHERGLYERMNTPADWFTTNSAYGTASYPAGAMLVDMLGYVISDSLRDAWLHEYYRRRKFQHPDPYDLEKFAEDVSGLRLDWYFEQYTNTTRRVDYALTDLDQHRTGDGWTATLQLEREDEIVMPIDVRLTLEDGSTQWINIPLGIMQGHKPVPDSWIVAEPWRWTFPEYTLPVDLPARVARAEIDPNGGMPDHNRLNNTSGFPIEARFLQPPQPTWFDYGVGYRPLLQYASDFGIGGGFQARGRYLFGPHRLKGMVKIWPEVLFSGGDDPALLAGAAPSNLSGQTAAIAARLAPDLSAFDGIDYELRYTRELPSLGPETTFRVSATKHLGVLENTLAVNKPLGPPLGNTDQRVSVALIHQYNETDRVFGQEATTAQIQLGPLRSVTIPTVANPFRQEHMLSARLIYRTARDGDQLEIGAEVGASLRSREPFAQPVSGLPSPDETATANRFYLTARKTASLGPFEGRAAVQFGLGASTLALHKRFQLGGLSVEEQWRHDAFRSAFAAFENPAHDAHLAAFGMAGPVAYLRNETDQRPATLGLIGSNVVAGRLTLGTHPSTNVQALRPLWVEAFSGLGETWSHGAFLAGFDADALLADAGFGIRYDLSSVRALNRWTAQSDVLSGLRLTARFPVWASDPGLIDPNEGEWALRWLIGVQADL